MTTPKLPTTHVSYLPPARTLDAVAIGASAGGVEALNTLLSALPATTKVSIFIVLHLPRDRNSLLVEIFSPRCALPVREAQDKEPIERGTVYFAPPDYHLLVDEGPQFALSFDEPVHYSRPSIDVLFESASDIYRERLLGIILTGANQDGAAGLETVHRRGGLTVVQEPSSAQAWMMPSSALERHDPDFVLSLPEIAALLAELGEERA